MKRKKLKTQIMIVEDKADVNQLIDNLKKSRIENQSLLKSANKLKNLAVLGSLSWLTCSVICAATLKNKDITYLPIAFSCLEGIAVGKMKLTSKKIEQNDRLFEMKIKMLEVLKERMEDDEKYE